MAATIPILPLMVPPSLDLNLREPSIPSPPAGASPQEIMHHRHALQAARAAAAVASSVYNGWHENPLMLPPSLIDQNQGTSPHSQARNPHLDRTPQFILYALMHGASCTNVHLSPSPPLSASVTISAQSNNKVAIYGWSTETHSGVQTGFASVGEYAFLSKHRKGHIHRISTIQSAPQYSCSDSCQSGLP